MEWKRILDHTASFWKPEEAGDAIEGVLLSVGIGQNGPFLTLKKNDGGEICVGIATVLERVKWEELISRRVRITFIRTEVSKTGRTYMLFDVDVEA